METPRALDPRGVPDSGDRASRVGGRLKDEVGIEGGLAAHSARSSRMA
jgi:hypothetical protein